MKYNPPVGSTDPNASYVDKNVPGAVRGSAVPAPAIEFPQREIVDVIAKAGLTPSPTLQLWDALKFLGLSSALRSRRWTNVISMTLSSAPGAPAEGDLYLVPAGATGVWAGNYGKIAEWSGLAWSYFTPSDGHGISLPDGRVFERIGGTYAEKLALDAQSGKWSTGAVGGTPNAITATLTPAPSALTSGMSIVLIIATPNTGPATLNVGGSGALQIVNQYGAALSGRELTGPVRFTYDGTKWWATVTQPVLTANLTFYVNSATGNDANNGVTAGTAFATIQKAVTQAQRINLNGYGIGINVADGNYTGPVILGPVSGGAVTIVGNANTPANCIVSQPVGSSFLGTTGQWNISGFTVSAAASGGGDPGCGVYAAGSGSQITISNMNFGACFGPHIYASNGGQALISGQINITGSAPSIMTAAVSGSVTINPSNNPVLNLPSNVTISNAVTVADDLGTIWGRFSSVTGAGTVTGKKFSASKNGVIDTLGSGINHYPGTTAGTTTTGGQYA